jgi:lipopolysaccharide biosynthesis regulator YciM
MFQPPQDFDPYRDLVELKNFASTADVHLGNLLKNEKEIVKAINELNDVVKKIKQKIALLDSVLANLVKEK